MKYELVKNDTKQVAGKTLSKLYTSPQPAQQCRTDGRCQYAIDSGAEGMGHCPKGKCVMPARQQEPDAIVTSLTAGPDGVARSGLDRELPLMANVYLAPQPAHQSPWIPHQRHATKDRDMTNETHQPTIKDSLMVQHVSVTDKLVDAYCKAWEQSFTADNPYHTVRMTAEDRKHIEAGLKAALAEQSAQQEPPAWWPAVENILKEYGLQAIDFVADFKAALADQPAPVQGWKLVPVDPTPEQIKEGNKVTWPSPCAQVYSTMLAAAPQPAQPQLEPLQNIPSLTTVLAYLERLVPSEVYTGMIDVIEDEFQRKQQPAQQEPVATESVLIDGTAYTVAAPVACEMLRLHLEIKAAPVQHEQMAAAKKDAVFEAAIEFVGTLTGMKPPPIETAPPEIFKPFRDFTEKVCSIFAAPQPAQRKPMTDGQISWLWSEAHNDTSDRMAFQVFARAIEAAHNIKEQP